MKEKFSSTWIKGIYAQAPFTSSSKLHRTGLRMNSGVQTAADVLQSLNESAIIPFKLAQALISFNLVFHTNTHATEKFIQLLLGCIAIAQIGLLITFLFENDECLDNPDTTICKAYYLMQLFFQGILIGTWIPAEVSRDSNRITEDEDEDPDNENPEAEGVDIESPRPK